MDSLSKERQMDVVESFTLKVIATMENGVMIRSTDMEYNKQRMEADMKANGKMTSKTVKEKKHGLMALLLKDYTRTE